MSWQDVRRAEEQREVMEALKKYGGHPKVPFKMLRDTENNEACTTLGTIRVFLDDQLAGFTVESRILNTGISELKRPVKYFWSIHDFVRGLRGALLGHQYLTSIGILLRDISEHNIALALLPGDVHGYIIDLDMAILREPETPSRPVSQYAPVGHWAKILRVPSVIPLKSNDCRPIKAIRTGITPYLSSNVLRGRKHTHFDDIESFLYVLLLFFFSYAGPLSTEELQRAHDQGFVQSPGSGRLSHMRSWPRAYVLWAEGDPQIISKVKAASLKSSTAVGDLIQSCEVQECLQKNWDADLHDAIVDLLAGAWWLFSQGAPGLDYISDVSHDQFIAFLDEWLKVFAPLEEQFSNCPFPRPSVPS